MNISHLNVSRKETRLEGVDYLNCWNILEGNNYSLEPQIILCCCIMSIMIVNMIVLWWRNDQICKNLMQIFSVNYNIHSQVRG